MSAGRLVSRNASAKSWRAKLAVVEELMADESLELSDAVLADVAVYLRFLSTGEIPCEEDGRHFRPSHHARMAAQIHERLRKLSSPSPEPYPSPAKEGSPNSNALASDVPLQGGGGGGLPHKSASTMTGSAFLIRKTLACLPSTAAPFQRAEPLTRIRDIAHRNDIPHDLKREFKTTLQNKLHRCAGPEDLVTNKRLLERITAPEAHYAPDFVEQFKIFHGELTEFFNARSLEDRLHALASNTDEATQKLINGFLEAKQQQTASDQCRALANLTQLRQRLLDVAEGKTGAEHQELWLADIALEDYAFLLLSELVNRAQLQPTPDPSQEGNYPAGASRPAPLLGGAGGGLVQGRGENSPNQSGLRIEPLNPGKASNIQHRTPNGFGLFGLWMLVVRCWLLDVPGVVMGRGRRMNRWQPMFCQPSTCSRLHSATCG